MAGHRLRPVTGRPEVGSPLTAALAAPRWRAREQHLAQALEAAAARHNRLGLTEPVPATVRRFYRRPYQVLGGDRFAEALRASVASPRIRELPLAGAVDQFIDSTDALADAAALRPPPPRCCMGPASPFLARTTGHNDPADVLSEAAPGASVRLPADPGRCP